MRRLALARVDLALVLARSGEPTEAADLGALALDSGRLVLSNLWRATELNGVLDRYGPSADIDTFRARYVETHRDLTGRATAPDQ